jgi:membrane protein
MQDPNTSLLNPPIQTPSHYSIIKRIVNLVLVVICVVVCVNLWLISSDQSSNWYNKQGNQLGKSLASLSANILSRSVLEKDPQILQQQLGFILADPHVLSASLFDNKGRLLSNQSDVGSVVDIYKLGAQHPLVFVHNIKDEGLVIGYLQIMLKESKVMQYHSEYQRQLYQQVQVLMLLAAIAGILFTRFFYKIRYRQKLRAGE